MSPLFAKLNLGEHREILVLDAPAAFDAELERLAGVTVQRDARRVRAVRFALAFAERRTELDRLSAVLVAKAEGDAVLWIAYPKGTSKRYRCDFNRDTGWSVLTAAGYETVRAVAIDADWTALRFRRTEFMGKPRRARGGAKD